MHRVLDVDLDFFLTDVCPLAPLGERPDARWAAPWPEERVVDFLENHLGLDKAHPLPGRIFETHDGALALWRQALQEGLIQAPFHVTHVDAHSDLGIGHPGPAFVLENVLAQPPEKRADMDKYYQMKKLDEANYLLFALAFRWVGSLFNVRNPNSRPDMPAVLLQGDHLRLQSSLGRLMPKFDFHEPPIPYREYGPEYKEDTPYDLISLALSPRYAPREADFIRDIFARYVRPV